MSKREYIVYGGRISEEKGIEELIKNKKKVDFIKKFETETIENAKLENNFEIIK